MFSQIFHTFLIRAFIIRLYICTMQNKIYIFIKIRKSGTFFQSLYLMDRLISIVVLLCNNTFPTHLILLTINMSTIVVGT